MMKINLGMIVATIALAMNGPSFAQDKTVHIATLDWPPYTGSELPAGGATTEVIRAEDGVDVVPLVW